jgi:hypothetical protein
MASNINPANPITLTPTTQSVRDNFQFAHDEIGALQAVVAGLAPLASPPLTGNPTAPTPAPGDNDTSIATTAFVQAAVSPLAASLHGIGRNYLHNPLFNIGQRGAGPFTANGYTLDRWNHAISGDTISVSQYPLADVHRAQIGDEAAQYCYANTFTGSAASNSFDIASQYIEDVFRLAGKTVTISLWAWAAAGTPKLGIGIGQFFGFGGSPSASVYLNGIAVTLSTVPTRYSATIALPSVAGKVIGTNGNHATELDLWFSGGSSFNSRSGGVGVQSASINLWGVQLEVGPTASPLEKPDPGYDAANCSRFFYKGQIVGGASMTSGQQLFVPISFSVPMRGQPTLTALNDFSSGTQVPSLNVNNNRDGFVAAVAAVTGNPVINIIYSAAADL